MRLAGRKGQVGSPGGRRLVPEYHVVKAQNPARVHFCALIGASRQHHNRPISETHKPLSLSAATNVRLLGKRPHQL
jgi:hypothetical protein